jgi:leukotriene-A4 hydrolase
MTTDKFINYLNENLLDLSPKWFAEVNTKEWVYNQGLPTNCPVIQSKELMRVSNTLEQFKKDRNVLALKTDGYTTHHWLYFLRKLPELNLSEMKKLDDRFHFTQSGNAEIQCDWYQLAVQYKYEAAYPAMEKFLISVGRRKFLLPLYKGLLRSNEGRTLAIAIFKKAEPGYHSVAANTIRDMIAGKE